MNRRGIVMVAAVLALISAGAASLLRMKSIQTLGWPAVTIVDEPALDPDGNKVGDQSVALPATISGYSSEIRPVESIETQWLPSDTTFGKRRYQSPDGFWADLNVVVMGTDRGSIHKPEICLEGQGWTITRSEVATIPIRRPHPYELSAMKLTASFSRRNPDGRIERFGGVYVFWFVADGEMTPYHGERMWWMARDLIVRGVLQRWAYIACFAPCLPGREAVTFERMKGLIAAAIPEFQRVAGPESPGARAAR